MAQNEGQSGTGTARPPGGSRRETPWDQLRHQVARRVFRGRIRLGDGRSLAPILPEDLEDIRRRFPRPKYFVFGHARSGTSFLARLLRLHPDIHCEWQTQFFSERGPVPYLTAPSFQNWLTHPSDRWTRGWNPTAAFLRVACDTLLERGAEQAGKPIVGDKSPNENGAEAVEWLGAVYPDARLIYIVRDGRDTVLSKRVQAFIDQPETLDRRDRRIREAILKDPTPFLERRRSLFSAPQLAAAARGWSRAVEGSVASARNLFGDRAVVVRYEDLLVDPLSNLKALWSFLGAGGVTDELEGAIRGQIQDNPEAAWHETSEFVFVKQIPRGVQGGWRSVFTPGDAEVFAREARSTLQAYGYPIDA